MVLFLKLSTIFTISDNKQECIEFLREIFIAQGPQDLFMTQQCVGCVKIVSPTLTKGPSKVLLL